MRNSLSPLGLSVFLVLAAPAFGVIDGKKVDPKTPARATERAAISATVKLTLQRKDGSLSTCSGAVISKAPKPSLIATAAHCTDKGNEVVAITYLDATNLTPIVVERPVDKKNVHSKWDVTAPAKEARDDYAVLVLNKGDIPEAAGEIDFPVKNCPVLVLPPENGEPDPAVPSNYKLLIAGYGANEVTTIRKGKDDIIDPNNPPKGAGTLRYGSNELSAIRAGVINFRGASINKTPPTGKWVGVGPGDSGGPIYAAGPGESMMLVGIHGSLDRPVVRTPDGQINEAVNTCDPKVGEFVMSVYWGASMKPRIPNTRSAPGPGKAAHD